MRIGITGHQTRDRIDWSWVKNTIRFELSKIVGVEQCLSSLASGSDQVFAEVALDLGIPVLAVIPVQGYERYFKGKALAKYRRLLSQCKVSQLNWSGDDERAFLDAGKNIVEKSDMLFAVWDGKQAQGRGGTGDVVLFAQKSAKPIVHINPIDRSIQRI
jgi:hypothetical protein